MRGQITMSAKEAERISVLDDVKARRLKQRQAAGILGISARQLRRILRRYKQEGKQGLIHRSRGRISNRAIAQEEKDRAIEIIRQCYVDFGPTLAHEKLQEQHGVQFGVDTLRKEMIKQGLWRAKIRKVKNLHPYRQRRACIGEMVQLDGSPFAWFGDRAEPCTLLAFIDDATSRIMDGEFVEYEGTLTLFGATKHYLIKYGKPLAWYIDRHSTFKVNRQATVEEELKDVQPQSQFARAMEELGIKLIFANSPQAKGRVERLFETLQDRLVKEMRLVGIRSWTDGTAYLREVYIPKHNAKFAVAPREKGDLHRPLLASENLRRIFTLQSQRTVSKDLLVEYKNRRYQLTPANGQRYTLRNTKITVAEGEEDNVVFLYKNQQIPFSIACQKAYRQNTREVVSAKLFNERRVHIPAPDHPWRRGFAMM